MVENFVVLFAALIVLQKIGAVLSLSVVQLNVVRELSWYTTTRKFFLSEQQNNRINVSPYTHTLLKHLLSLIWFIKAQIVS